MSLDFNSLSEQEFDVTSMQAKISELVRHQVESDHQIIESACHKALAEGKGVLVLEEWTSPRVTGQDAYESSRIFEVTVTSDVPFGQIYYAPNRIAIESYLARKMRSL